MGAVGAYHAVLVVALAVGHLALDDLGIEGGDAFLRRWDGGLRGGGGLGLAGLAGVVDGGALVMTMGGLAMVLGHGCEGEQGHDDDEERGFH